MVLPELPDGWEYVARPGCFLRALSPDGREWLVLLNPGAEELVRWRYATEEDVARPGVCLHVGERFLDETERVALPACGGNAKCEMGNAKCGKDKICRHQ
jgi:hypothetical protein